MAGPFLFPVDFELANLAEDAPTMAPDRHRRPHVFADGDDSYLVLAAFDGAHPLRSREQSL